MNPESAGREFLTWLLIRILAGETLDNSLRLASTIEPSLRVDIEGPMRFRADGAEAHTLTLAGAEAALAPEALSALRQGKQLIRARIVFVALEDCYRFTFDEAWAISSIRLPVPAISDADKHFEARMEAMQRLEAILNELWSAFVALRLDDAAWADELRIRAELLKAA